MGRLIENAVKVTSIVLTGFILGMVLLFVTGWIVMIILVSVVVVPVAWLVLSIAMAVTLRQERRDLVRHQRIITIRQEIGGRRG